MDDSALKGGDQISASLLRALEASRISIVVLSENYAFSTWCLEELVNIVRCRRTYAQVVLPIFYDVDPSDVRKQTGRFDEAMVRHIRRFGDKSEKIKEWRSALTEIANLRGWDFRYGYLCHFFFSHSYI
uniref:ADP-ribosyl cyclase/cyclic ADP-ribose hydrolase n=1 Tax=Cajanus cajan TaxID=3821 RepID=A0A151U274_CAJCA|nr:TMV resistance protein N [Cajanus cajan]